MASGNAYPPLHTAEHLLTRLLFTHFPSLKDIAIRLKSRKCVIDFHLDGTITDEDRATMERELRAIAHANLPATIVFIPREVAARTMPNLHQVPADADPVRIVRVGAGETLADERCCIGIHVEATGEIHDIRLPTLRREADGKWRITLVVGN